MIDNLEMNRIIGKEIPQAAQEIAQYGLKKKPYLCMAILVNVTKEKLKTHDLKSVVSLLELVDRFYQKGTHLIKNAVENVFVFSFASFQKQCNVLEWKVIRTKMPVSIQELYVNQIYPHQT